MPHRQRNLSTERLLLRRPRAGDAPLLFEAFASDPEVTRYLTWRPHASIAEAEAALVGRIQRLEAGSEHSWILELTGPASVAGLISAWIEGDSAEIGFVIARSRWNQGLATEAVRAVGRWALDAASVRRVWASCDVDNRASARVLEKAGFAARGACDRDIVRPNLSPDPRPSLLFELEAASA